MRSKALANSEKYRVAHIHLSLKLVNKTHFGRNFSRGAACKGRALVAGPGFAQARGGVI